METIRQVTEFHKTTDSNIEPHPCIPGLDRIALRIDLIAEELEELRKAAYQKDVVEVLDALCDLQYVLTGTVLEFGMQNIFEAAFNEVHDSNMSKFCKDTMEAKAAADSFTFHKMENKRRDAYFKKVGNHFVIRDSYTEKILKGPRFRQPDLKSIIDNYRQAQ